MIGLSVSKCIAEIIDGKVAESEVEKIIARTAAENDEDWEFIISLYKRDHWQKNPKEAEAIIRRLLKAKKIEQPRLKGRPLHSLEGGIWR